MSSQLWLYFYCLR